MAQAYWVAYRFCWPIVAHVTILKGVLSFKVSHLHGDETLPRTPLHFDLLIELGHAGITNIKWESKNEMNSGSFRKIKSSWKWSLVVFTIACSLHFRQKNITWSVICKKNFTYSYEKEWSGWVKQHTLNETFGFLERTLVSKKKKRNQSWENANAIRKERLH